MEVVVLPVQDFQFDSTTTTPYVSAPSSPKRFGDSFDYYYHYTSAPASPTGAAAIYAHANNLSFNLRSLSPSPPLPPNSSTTGEDDFAFDFSGQLEKGVLPTADELFDKGKIRPLKPPPRLLHPSPDDRSSLATSPRSPASPRRTGLWSPRRRGGSCGGERLDPFTAAMVEVTSDRGRDRNIPSSISSSKSRKGSRSLSPLRGEVGVFTKSPNSPTPSTSSSAPLKSGGSKKWRFKDLLLFRSASEGRVTGNRSKDPLRRYSISPSLSSSSLLLPSTNRNDSMNSSFRSTDSNGWSMRRGSGVAISAHEMHYAANRAASMESKKKTPLAYRQGLFSCLGFNPAVNSIARGLNGCSLINRRNS